MAINKIKAGHGLAGSGLGHPENMGVVGPGGKFMGRTHPVDNARTVTDNEEVDEVGSKKVPANVGMKPHKTGGMSRKDRGVVGPGDYKGTK